MKGSTGTAMQASRGMPTIRRGLYRSLVKGPPEPRVPVKQPKIPGLGANHKNRKHSREVVIQAKLLARILPLWAVAARLGLSASLVKSWVSGFSCADWEPTPAEVEEFVSKFKGV